MRISTPGCVLIVGGDRGPEGVCVWIRNQYTRTWHRTVAGVPNWCTVENQTNKGKDQYAVFTHIPERSAARGRFLYKRPCEGKFFYYRLPNFLEIQNIRFNSKLTCLVIHTHLHTYVPYVTGLMIFERNLNGVRSARLVSHALSDVALWLTIVFTHINNSADKEKKWGVSRQVRQCKAGGGF